MATINFTTNLRKHIDTPVLNGAGATVGEALAQALDGAPRLRDYVLDEQGRLRRHVTIFIDNQMIRDRAGMSDPIRDSSEIFVMQALSGG